MVKVRILARVRQILLVICTHMDLYTRHCLSNLHPFINIENFFIVLFYNHQTIPTVGNYETAGREHNLSNLSL